jgi:hypothetical protein
MVEVAHHLILLLLGHRIGVHIVSNILRERAIRASYGFRDRSFSGKRHFGPKCEADIEQLCIAMTGSDRSRKLIAIQAAGSHSL